MKANSTLEELKTFMSSLGFDYYDGTYYQCFKKEEGNCEITMTGAKDLQKSFQRKQLEAVNKKVIEFASNVRKIDGTHEDVLIAYKNVVDYVKHEVAELEDLKGKL